MSAAAYGPPKQQNYDVVIVGGGIQGASTAWFLSQNPDFNGSVLVVERDPSYAHCASMLSNSCIRQQFSCEINIRVSQFGAEFVENLRQFMGGDERVPEIPIQTFGYLYLADNERFADALRFAQGVQAECGAGTRLMSPDEILREYPFYQLEDIVLGSHNTQNEGYFEGITMFDWFRRSGREHGIEYLANEVVAIGLNTSSDRVESVTLATGEQVGCGQLVNASGTRAARTARMAGVDVPVEPRKRYSYVFDAAEPLDRPLPLTIDPSGIHMRTDGPYYLAGCKPDDDSPPEHDDFEEDHSIWEEKVWPVLATRVPAFERIKLIRSWVGHYEYNTLDHNAILGPHTQITNFLFQNGFSGHGLQQSPAMGRGMSELITYGDYRSLDLTPFSYLRIEKGIPFDEKAVI